MSPAASDGIAAAVAEQFNAIALAASGGKKTPVAKIDAASVVASCAQRDLVHEARAAKRAAAVLKKAARAREAKKAERKAVKVLAALAAGSSRQALRRKARAAAKETAAVADQLAKAEKTRDDKLERHKYCLKRCAEKRAENAAQRTIAAFCRKIFCSQKLERATTKKVRLKQRTAGAVKAKKRTADRDVAKMDAEEKASLRMLNEGRCMAAKLPQCRALFKGQSVWGCGGGQSRTRKSAIRMQALLLRSHRLSGFMGKVDKMAASIGMQRFANMNQFHWFDHLFDVEHGIFDCMHYDDLHDPGIVFDLNCRRLVDGGIFFYPRYFYRGFRKIVGISKCLF
ncbi:hypothetical protein M885DRAFT_602419 [Pelagophyceae sp. CCMP2097]|nr:hypothetical protein M885DRAFT_602419 [Pelagophyceae sp. CCMP2097]